jgi:alpha-L-glutamate ligase-like protein
MLKRTPRLFLLAWALILLPFLRVIQVGWLQNDGAGSLLDQLFPVRVFDVELVMELSDADGESVMRTFLPETGSRQILLEEEVMEGPGISSLEKGKAGRQVTWTGNGFFNPAAEMRVRYRYRVRTQPLQVVLDSLPDVIPKVRPSHKVYLEPTATVQSQSPEIHDFLRASGVGDSLTLIDNVRKVFDAVSALRPAPFKGTTDALTALRLQEASCNGRSRLMVACLRNMGIPARLVGGLILTSGKKRTSHQWLEAQLGGVWVPFDALNGHWASLPANYLRLYTGDEGLFKHTTGLPFAYEFNITPRLILPQEGLEAVSVWKAFAEAGIPVSLLQFLLLMPIGAVIVALMRNVIGVRTFGLFLPALLAVSMRETGFVVGSSAFVLVIALVAALHPLLERWRLMYTPRLVILLVAVVSLFLGISALGLYWGQIQFAYITLFPIVIVAITAERFARKWEESGAAGALSTALQTFVVVGGVYLALGSITLETAFLAFPVLFLSLVGLMLILGRWTGVRVSEYIRFRRVEGFPLGMNARNVLGVFKGNSTRSIAIANDKIATKRMLETAGVPVSPLRGVFDSIQSLSGLKAVLDRPVALKPAAGRGGGGILLVQPRAQGGWEDIHGDEVSWAEIFQHATEIIHGRFSFGDEDALMVEDLLSPDPDVQALHGKGIADFRFIYEEGKLLMAMLRLPTKQSEGKANLHAGGVGVCVDLEAGTLGQVVSKEGVSDRHPDGPEVTGLKVPHWNDLLRVADQAAAVAPLGYVGVDLVLDRHLGPVVLEWNARPGLEIQNVHGAPLELAESEESRPWGFVAAMLVAVALIGGSDMYLVQALAEASTEVWYAGNAEEQENIWQWDEAASEDAAASQDSPLWGLAREAEKRKDWERAEAIWLQLTADLSENPDVWMGLARVRMRGQIWSGALTAFDQALARDSANHAAWVNSGIALSQLERPASAAARYHRAQALEPTRMSAWLNEGIAWVKAGDFERALAPLRHAEERTTGRDRAKVLTYLGQAHRGLGDENSARTAYEEAIALNPRSELARLGLVQLESDGDSRLAGVEAVLALNPRSSLALFEKGRILEERGQISAAERCMEQALDLHPESQELVRELASFYLDNAAVDQAMQMLGVDSLAAEVAEEVSPQVYFIQGRIASKKDQYDDALAAYDRALELSNGEMAEAWLNRGVVLKRLGRIEEAVSSYRSAAQTRVDYPEAWYNMALAFGELNQIDSVVKAYSRCLELDPKSPNAHYNLGIAYKDLGEYSGAVDTWQRAVELDPNMRKAWFNLGIYLRRLGRLEEAVAAYDSLLLSYPEDERAWFNRGIALRDLGRAEEAKSSYRRAIESDANYAGAWLNLGSLQAESGEAEEALTSFEEAVALEPANPEARFNLGLQLNRMGRKDEAILAFEQSAGLDPEYERPREQLLALYTEIGDRRGVYKTLDAGLTRADRQAWGGDSLYEYARELHRRDLQLLAIERYGEAIDSGKEGPWPLYWRAKANEELRNFDAAIAGYEETLEANDTFKFALYRLSIVLKDSGKLAEARGRWAKLEELYPEFAVEKLSDKP